MTQDNQAGTGAQPAPAQLPVFLPLQQECADYATSLRSTMMQVKLEGRLEPESMARAADLFERAATRITDLDASESQLIKERDHAQEMADRLAQAISEEFRVDVGEHSNLNCPWHQALAVLNGEYITDSDKDQRIAALKSELSAAHAHAKHWRSNHDNVVARLRVFTQRPDLPQELADRLPWYRELVRLLQVAGLASPVDALLFEHDDGRYAVNPDTTNDPARHRVGPVTVYAVNTAPISADLRRMDTPTAWMDPLTQDVINDTRKQAWTRDYGAGGAAKAAAYTVALGPLAPATDAREVLVAPAVAVPDDFRGDTATLVRNIIALLELDAEGALVPHGVGGHARGLLSAAAARLAAAAAQEHARPDQRRRVEALIGLLNRRPAMNAGLPEAYAFWNAECYQALGALSHEAANADQAQEAAPALEAPAAPVPATVAWLNKPILVQNGEKIDDLPPTVDFERHAAAHEWEQAEPLVRLSDALAYAAALAAAPQAPAAPLGETWALIEALVKAECHKVRIHQEYTGKVMPDDVYERFQKLRDERISEISNQLQAALSAAPAAPAVDAREDEHAKSEFNRGFNAATCVALQVLRGFGDTDSTAWNEIVKTAGRAEIENYAKNIAPENWELCGFAHIAAQAKGGSHD